MIYVSYSELAANLAQYMDAVCDSRETMVVTRQNARSVVLISEEEFSGLMETIHLLRSPENAARLMRSIADADAGQLSEHPLTESASAE